MKKIRLIALDLDGTLLNRDKQVSDTTLSVLTQARSIAHVHIVLASARPPRTVLPFHKQLGLETAMVNYNGALVLHPLSNRVLLHRPIPARYAIRAVTLAKKIYPKGIISAEIMDRWYTDRFVEQYDDEKLMTETAKLCRPDHVGPVETWLNRPVTKLLILGKQERLREIAAILHAELSRELTVVQTEEHILQIIHVMASKSRALQTIIAELGITREEVMAVGDNANDSGMLKWAGVGVAMANAVPRALAAADYITENNNSNGVANAVRKIILENRSPGRTATKDSNR